MRRILGSIIALGGFGLTLGGAYASAQLPFLEPASRPPPVLDVPYLAQSELLCGGAALAMVERWWGRRGVYAEDFAGLVRPAMRGIRTIDLADAARARGWTTTAFDGTPSSVQQQLAQGVPVVTLIRVGHDRYHYVVVLGWAGGRVTYHDPARAPSQVIDERRFMEAWNGGERWAMTLRPVSQPTDASTSTMGHPDTTNAEPSSTTADSMPCRPWLDQALDAVALNHLDEASALLDQAGQACPTEPLVLRELAGVRFKQDRLAESIQLSDRYLARAPDDALGWQLLATSRYLTGDRDGALRAWNRLGRPTVDLVRIDGVHAIRFQPLAEAMQTPPGTQLTPTRLALARRRLSDIPAVRQASVAYQPVAGGAVELRAAVTERTVLGPAWRLLAGNALRALTQHDVGVTIATPTGAGEVWGGTWRWEHAHPRVAVRVDLPVHIAFDGVLGVAGSWERFRFSLNDSAPAAVEETRRSVGVSFGSWVNSALRPSVGLRFERWSGARKYVVATAGTEFRSASDRFVLTTSAEYGRSLPAHPSYSRGNLRAIWSSSVGLSRATWSGRLGVDLASPQAPLGVWPVASGDIPWAIPLRAHPRTSDGLLPGATAGRAIMHGGLSGDQPVFRAGPFTVAAGIFLDGAEIVNPADGSARNRFYLDAGGGIRIGLLEGQLGILRIDLATGLTDHRSAITAGVHQSWPPFRENTR